MSVGVGSAAERPTGGLDVIERTKRKLIESAQSQLEPGEQVREVMIAQTIISPWLLLLTWLLWVFAKQRVVFATDRNIYVFERSLWSNKVQGLLGKYALGSVRVEKQGSGLAIADQEKLYPYLGWAATRDRIVALAAG